MKDELLPAVLPEQRRLQIAAQLRRETRVRVDELAHRYAVSGETIRRDLQVLEARGLLRRVYGGAVPLGARGWDADGAVARLDPKRAIAAAAAALVEPGDTIVLDIGTTVAEAARALPATFAGRALCTSVAAAAELAGREGVEVHLAGGRLRRADLACTGPSAERFFAEFFADRAFLAADGIHPRAGVTAGRLEEVAVRHAILRQSRENYVLADASKLGRVAVGRVCPLSDITAVVTDADADPDTVRALQQAGTKVVVAPSTAVLD
ncbi:DeoR family transcriptional regulator [Krasilnikovia cinnamomea]|uniref:DeoR family transcriptional regulator n=1 Tax=Krasilnikovia cinnamomea TaxID=349313 RepID=A0A4Q7ZRG0_9ACTN|nr:DeoR/GlpR family DNA-binding transcription regulator [Krasilnikovia cinnamomea]RZU53738.1 DeoR family transcriptional regulator [Krasilnikovia cinnamomea]